MPKYVGNIENVGSIGIPEMILAEYSAAIKTARNEVEPDSEHEEKVRVWEEYMGYAEASGLLELINSNDDPKE